MKKAVSRKKNTSVSTEINYDEYAGAGLENTDKNSFAIPFITLLQGLSPQLESVDGAKPGMFYNNITDEVSSAVTVIPCAFQRRYIRWSPRSAGGGYKGEYDPVLVETGQVEGLKKVEEKNVYLADVPADTKKLFDADGKPLFDELRDTRNHFVLVKNKNGEWSQAILSLSSTQIKKSKKWMSRIDSLKINGKPAPMFSHSYVLTSVKEENAMGKWWGVEINIDALVTDAEVFRTAAKFYTTVSEGKIEAVPHPAAEEKEVF